MEYTHLGRSGLSVSRLCLGTMNFGPLTPAARTRTRSWTTRTSSASTSSTPPTSTAGRARPGRSRATTTSHAGWTEEIIGDWFAQGGGRRERTVLATKLYGDMGDWPNEGKLSALNIRRACDASLRRLQTDYIDLYQMHHVDRDTPWDEIWQAMEVLVAQGKILYVGLVQLRRLAHRAGQRDRRARAASLGLVSEQSHLQPDDPRDRAGGAARGDRLRRRRHPVVAAGRRAARRRARRSVRAAVASPGGPRCRSRRTGTRIQAYEDLCDELGEEPANVALAWLLHQDGVTAPIIGPRTLEQFDAAQRAVTLELGPDVLAQLDEIFPGYRTAPEHYAW